MARSTSIWRIIHEYQTTPLVKPICHHLHSKKTEAFQSNQWGAKCITWHVTLQVCRVCRKKNKRHILEKECSSMKFRHYYYYYSDNHKCLRFLMEGFMINSVYKVEAAFLLELASNWLEFLRSQLQLTSILHALLVVSPHSLQELLNSLAILKLLICYGRMNTTVKLFAKWEIRENELVHNECEETTDD